MRKNVNKSKLVKCLKKEILKGNLNFRFTNEEAWKACSKYKKFKRSTFGTFFSKHSKGNSQGEKEYFIKEKAYRLIDI